MRSLLGVLLLFLALNAFAGGYYAMSGAEGVPLEWLRNSPFKDYFLPGMFLFLVIGGIALNAGIAVFRKGKNAARLAIITGLLVLAWLVIQVAVIGFVSWMQPATAIVSILILILGYKLKYAR